MAWCGHDPTVPGCVRCELALTRSDYRAHWGLESPPRSGVNTDRPALVPCKSCKGDVKIKTHEEMPVASLKKLLAGPVVGLPAGWETWSVTAEAHRQLLAEAIEDAGPPPPCDGAGVVIGGGGAKFFHCAWIAASMLRWLGCKLPIQIWYLGRGELDPDMEAAARSNDWACVDARTVVKDARILNGWELKVNAVRNCPWRHVLWLDADSIPVRNPEYLFETPQYKEHGAIFFPDVPPGKGMGHDGKVYEKEWLPAVCWENVGLAHRNEVDFESGQFLVDKVKCWKALAATKFLNDHSDWVYKFVFGDKSTFHLGFRRADKSYALVPHGPIGRSYSLGQRDFQGAIVFEHATLGKEKLEAGEDMGFVTYPKERVDAWRVLRTKWTGVIWSWSNLTADEIFRAQTIPGRYRYTRVGLDARDLELLPNGHIGDGRAACEKRWVLRVLEGIPTLVIVGESHKGSEVGMMLLTLDRGDGVWRGAWQYHERCPAELAPILTGDPPAHWTFRAHTGDRDIFDCVVRENEYRLPGTFGSEDIIVDIGAHIGSFSYACLIRGAGKVLFVEPHVENFAIAMGNLAAKYCTRVRPVHAAMAEMNEVVNIGVFPGPNTGGAGICTPDAPTACQASTLNLAKILQMAGLGKPIRLLKLDCEGAEWESLYSTDLSQVQEIVAELHTGPEWAGKTAQLDAHLRNAGFDPVIELKHAGHGLGYLFAKRTSPKKNRVLLQMATGQHQQLLDASEACHAAYAQRHGMKYVALRETPTPHLPPSWGKLPAVLNQFGSGADVVVWMDADAVVADPNQDISLACDSGLGMAWYEKPFPHFQAGVFVAHRSDAVIQLLRDALATAESNVNDYPGGKYGVWEQGVLNELGMARGLITRIGVEWNFVPIYTECARPVVYAAHGYEFEDRLSMINRFVDKR